MSTSSNSVSAEYSVGMFCRILCRNPAETGFRSDSLVEVVGEAAVVEAVMVSTAIIFKQLFVMFMLGRKICKDSGFGLEVLSEAGSFGRLQVLED